MSVILLEGNLHLIGKVVSLHIGNKVLYFMLNVNFLYNFVQRVHLYYLSLILLGYFRLGFNIGCQSSCF